MATKTPEEAYLPLRVACRDDMSLALRFPDRNSRLLSTACYGVQGTQGLAGIGAQGGLIISMSEPPTGGVLPGTFWFNPVNRALFILEDNSGEKTWFQLSQAVPISFRQVDDLSPLFNGVEDTFNLELDSRSLTPAELQSLLIFVGGVLQNQEEHFTLDSNQITFSEPVPAGLDFIGIVTNREPDSSGSPYVSNSVFLYLDDISELFDGERSTFELKLNNELYAPTPATNLLVVVGGVPQSAPQAFSTWGSSITFTEPPPPGLSFAAITSSFV